MAHASGEDLTPNDLVAFVVELATLAVLAVWGHRLGDTAVVGWLLAVAVPVAAAVAWGLFAAPRSRFDVPILEVATKVVVLGGAVLAARTLLSPGWWWAFAVVVVANTLLVYVGPWARGRRTRPTADH